MNSPLNLKRKEAFDIGIKGELEDFLQEKQIPTLVVPAKPQAQPAPTPAEPPKAIVAPPQAAKPKPRPVKQTAPEVVPEAGAAKKIAVSAYMPDYVYKALRKRAFDKEMSVTSYILHALALAKIPVRDEDLLCDGRKADPVGRVDILSD